MSELHGRSGNGAGGEGDGADPILTLGVTDTSAISTDLWMVRVPNKIAEIWQNAPEGTELGELVFKKGGKKRVGKLNQTIKPSISIECTPESLETLADAKSASDTPLHYTMEAMTKKVPNLYPFRRHPNGQVDWLGTVRRTANLQALRQDPRYRQLNRNRLLQSSVNNTRYVKPVEATELSVRKSVGSGVNKGFGSAVQAYGMRLKEDRETGGNAGANNDRKRKYQDTPTRSVVFELFSLQPFWTVKQLKEESGKPEKEIRNVLNDIGDYHRSGEHKNMWALKIEYQQGNNAASANPSANAGGGGD